MSENFCNDGGDRLGCADCNEPSRRIGPLHDIGNTQLYFVEDDARAIDQERPHSVSSTPREVRSSSAAPTACSMSVIALEIAVATPQDDETLSPCCRPPRRSGVYEGP